MKRTSFSLLVLLILSPLVQAQKDTVYVPGYFESDSTIGTLNHAIESVKVAGTISNTVFMLTPNDQYVLSSGIFLEKGQNLEVIAPKPESTQETAPPQIVWQDEDLFEDRYEYEVIISTYGNLTLKNIWVRYADINGQQLWTGIVFEDDSIGTGLDSEKEYGKFDGVIFDYFPLGPEAGGAITVKTNNFVGIFENSYFRNGTDPHFQYYGRAISFPYWTTGNHIDSLIFENTTFSNLSRIVMMEGYQFVSNLHLNHVTLINSLEWAIQSGWWEDVSITNSIFVNTQMMGYRPIDVCLAEEPSFEDFENGLCNPPGGGLIQDIVPVDSMGFDPGFTDQDRQVYIGNNAYYYEDYLLDLYYESTWAENLIRNQDHLYLRYPFPAVGEKTRAFFDSSDTNGEKVFPNLNIEEFYSDSAGFNIPPTNQDTMIGFIFEQWGFGSYDLDWSYYPQSSFRQQWPLPEDLSYTNTDYLETGWGGYPLGDLNWFPEDLASWEVNQKEQDLYLINCFMGNISCGVLPIEDVVTVPGEIQLFQNYPNPFNPSTTISFSLPKASVVNLKVYDLLGREVAELMNGRLNAGEHSVNFDASGLSSGVYLYRIEAGGFSSFKRMVLIK